MYACMCVRIYIYIYIYTYICAYMYVYGAPRALLAFSPAQASLRPPPKSRECLGHHRKGAPGIGNADYVLNVG